MKKMKKLASLVLALAMALTLAVPAMAAEGDSFTITAPDNNRTYEIYQIFTGDYHDGKLSNIKWGANGNRTAGEPVEKAVLDELATVKNSPDTAKLEVIKKYVNLTSTKVGSVSNGQTLSVDPGYYLFKDIGPIGAYESYSLYIVEVVANVTIAPKDGTITFDKKVKDINDSESTEYTGWQDSADHDIGDRIPFQLKGTIPANYDKYTEYYFAFHDKESDGLDFDSDTVKVCVDGEQITTGYRVVLDCEDNACTFGQKNCTFSVIFDNLKNIPAVKAGSEITVEYESVLNEGAIIGSAGNPNEAYLEYSNEPNTKEHGKTPKDTVIVFTYKLEANKVTNNPDYKEGDTTTEQYISLKGAGFTLYKKQPVKNDDGTVKYDYQVVGSEVKGPDMTTFAWTGLDDGDYKLVETTTPPGYNTIDPIEFKIVANHVVNSQTPTLESLNGNKVSGQVTFSAKDLAEDTDSVVDYLTTDVVNQSGATLPETGGMGTTLFYALGAVLVIGAGVAMVTKKRMG